MRPCVAASAALRAPVLGFRPLIEVVPRLAAVRDVVGALVRPVMPPCGPVGVFPRYGPQILLDGLA